MAERTIVHERTYGKAYLGGFVHRARLRTIIGVLRRYVTPSHASWGDFGCSNGFVIASVMNECRFGFKRIVGHDQSRDLLDLAASKQIDNSEFIYRDLNLSPPQQAECFDLVTCFETLEHVADYRVAFEHLFCACSAGGFIVEAVPNETGLPGLAKLWTRRLARRDPYGDFFADASLAEYTRRLVSGAYIDDFRKPTSSGYGPHLGFDYRCLDEHVAKAYIESRRLALVEQRKTFLGMNVISVYRKPRQAA